MAKKSVAESVGRGASRAQTDSERVKKCQGSTESCPTKTKNPLSSGERAGVRADKTIAKPSSLLDTRVVYCGDNLEQFGPCRTGQFWGLPREIMPRTTTPHRLHRISRGESREKRAFEDRHENTKAYIDYMRPRCVQLARVLKQTGSFYYHCDWHASHYVKVMLN